MSSLLVQALANFILNKSVSKQKTLHNEQWLKNKASETKITRKKYLCEVKDVCFFNFILIWHLQSYETQYQSNMYYNIITRNSILNDPFIAIGPK